MAGYMAAPGPTTGNPRRPAVRRAGFTDNEVEIGRTVERLSRDWSLQPYQTSLAWLFARPAVASVIVFAETVDDVPANATGADVQLDQAQLDTLTVLTTSPRE
jgi:aryl-alcohol dehydrogenase-like predicted oxidoreductase